QKWLVTYCSNEDQTMSRLVRGKPSVQRQSAPFLLSRFDHRLLLSCFLASAACFSSPAQVNVWTYHNDNARTGQNLRETTLTPANVSAATFGKVGFFTVDGKVDAQPLLLSSVAIAGQGTHDVLYVVTEHDSVYGLDARTGAVL